MIVPAATIRPAAEIFPSHVATAPSATPSVLNLSYTNGPFYATVAYERHFQVNRQSDISAIYGVAKFRHWSISATVTRLRTGLGLSGQALSNYQTLCNADVADEDAFKVAALYTFPTKTTVGGIFEMLHRYVLPILRSRTNVSETAPGCSLTQELTPIDSVSFGWAHAFAAPGDPGQHNSANAITTTTGTGGLRAATAGWARLLPTKIRPT